MSCDLETVIAEGPVFRIARAPEPWAWPDWSQAGLDGTFGNRWDDPDGSYRVLYASSTRFGALIEMLAPFRPDLALVAGLREIDGESDSIEAGTVPREWFEHRLIGVAELVGTFADIGAAASLSLVRFRLAARAIHYGLADIDAAAIRITAPRGFTQDVSRLVYECTTAEDQSLAGIRYQSRLDDRTSNWAIFEPAPGSSWPLRSLDVEPLEPDDPDVTRALAVLGLRVG
ncbi:MAG: RES family NAD+ phosphorylase [Chloroflexi bacterium]|nr:RES family NAD+ phosphorylase [Chloroflexota bacterium]